MMINIKQLKNPKIIGLIVIILILNTLFLMSYKSLWLKSKKLRTQIMEKKEELAKSSTISVTLNALNSEVNQLSRKLSSLEERFFSNPEDILIYLNQSAATYKISLTSIEPRELEKLEIPHGKNLSEFPVNIGIKCDYHQLITFLNKIENEQKLIRVDEINIQRDPQDIWEHNIKILLEALVLISSGTKK